MSDHKVSIITPVYNCAAFLKDTIQSVLQQSYHDWELILIDDCSTDGSLKIANQLAASDKRLKVIQLDENGGAAVARNKGIDAATGQYIAFLDSDDLWLPHKLEAQLAFMQESNIAFSFSAYEKIDELDKSLGVVSVPERVDYNGLLKCCVIGCLTAIYDTEKLEKTHMPLIRKRQDLGLWLKLLKKTDYAYSIQEPLARYRMHNNSISSNKINAACYTWRLYREVENLSLLKSMYYFSFYAINGLIRHKLPRF